MQNHYNLLYREEEREMMGLCREEGVGVIPWSPLARGRLTRPWQDEPTTKRAGADAFGESLYKKSAEADKAVVAAVAEVAAEKGVPQAQVALAWLLAQARGHGSHHRGHQGAAPRGRGRGPVGDAERGRPRKAGGRLRPTSDRGFS